MLKITKNEESILKLLWTENRALSRTQIIELTPGRKWEPQSVHLLLNSLLDKGLIEVAGFERMGKRYGRMYGVAYTRPQLALRQMREGMQGEEGTDVVSLFEVLVNEQDVDVETLKQMEAILNKKREELQKARE